jgi:flagellar motor switch/type III secretory pathway protein FliN
MNTAMNLITAVPESHLAIGPHLVEKSQDRDIYETLPWLPCSLAVDIPVLSFKIGDLLGLAKGSIVETSYHQSSDLPLHVNGQLVGWTEFEVVGERLAVRLTDLS